MKGGREWGPSVQRALFSLRGEGRSDTYCHRETPGSFSVSAINQMQRTSIAQCHFCAVPRIDKFRETERRFEAARAWGGAKKGT